MIAVLGGVSLYVERTGDDSLRHGLVGVRMRAQFFEQSSKNTLAKASAMVPMGGGGVGLHVIPVEKAIETENQSVFVEHIEHWLGKYEGKYAASACSCRLGRAELGQGCDGPRGWCTAVGDMADYIVGTDRGRYITRDEVYEILQRAEDNGFVRQIASIDGENKIFAICNCNVSVYYVLRASQLFNTPICPALPTWPAPRPTSAWRAAVAWRCARPAPSRATSSSPRRVATAMPSP